MSKTHGSKPSDLVIGAGQALRVKADDTDWEAFTPISGTISHTHPESDVTNLPIDLTGKEPANSNIQVHITSIHAPSNAQKNSDILKSEIETVLTGQISTHTHIPPIGVGYAINVQALTSSPTDAQTIYFGMNPLVPVTTGGQSPIYIRAAGIIKRVELLIKCGTAGTAEAWSFYIRKNNTTDTLIATVSLSNVLRVVSNKTLNITMIDGDYFEIKAVNPTWSTNPLTCTIGGYVYIE